MHATSHGQDPPIIDFQSQKCAIEYPTGFVTQTSLIPTESFIELWWLSLSLPPGLEGVSLEFFFPPWRYYLTNIGPPASLCE